MEVGVPSKTQNEQVQLSVRLLSGLGVFKNFVALDSSVADLKLQIAKELGFTGEVLACGDRILNEGLLKDYCSSESIELTASRCAQINCEFARWHDDE